MNVSHESVEPLAIVGLAVRAPGAGSADQFWRNLVEGRESVTFFTDEEQRRLGVSAEDLEHPTWVSAAPIVDEARDFDAAAFGMTDREVLVMDPQHRMFLEVSRTAFDDAGYDPGTYSGAIGVYGGIGATNYQWENLRANREIWDAVAGQLSISTANSPDYLATQVSYRMNLRGPAMTVMTACSTSLVAVHLAAEAIRNGECDMAVAGGACIELPYGHGYVSMEGYTSPDGHCRPFDAQAEGTLWGSGAGVVVIKRLADAQADGDRIRAVIRGNAINNDGSGKVGFSAPSVEGQVGAVTAALEVGGIDPLSVGYVEAHGTGTALGDPIEVAALTQVYGRDTNRTQWCAIGSVKSNIGHLSQAAGVVALVKAVLSVESGLIPPTLHYTRANPAIDFAASPFAVADSLRRFTETAGPRRAGVSSFGIGGTNAHVVIEQAPPVEVSDAPESAGVVRLSAHTPAALDAMIEQLGRHLATTRDSLDDICATLHAGRPQLRHRFALAVADIDDAAEAIADPRRGHRGEVEPERREAPASVAFLFSGQGAQYPGMAAGAARASGVFADALQECLVEADDALRSLLLETTGSVEAAAELAQTRNTQPALFAVEYAAARWWMAHGVVPAAVGGHSIGEYVAAAIAGVMTPADAMRLVIARGELMDGMPSGLMVSVLADADEVRRVLASAGHPVDLAAVNGPGACVISGAAEPMAAAVADLDRAGLPHRALKVSHAFHSRTMDPILERFAQIVSGVRLSPPQIPMLSNVTGTWITDEQATDPEYWARHLRGTVRFADNMDALLSEGDWALVECGPGSQLVALAGMHGGAQIVVPSLPGPREQVDAQQVLLDSAARLWCAGVPVDTEGAPRRRVGLPTYPYQRQRHWVDLPEASASAGAPAAGTATSAPAQGAPAPAAPSDLPRDPRDWFAVASWRQLPPVTTTRIDAALVIGEEPGRAVARGLAAAGVRVDVVPEIPDALSDVDVVVDARPLTSADNWQSAILPSLKAVQRLADEGSAELVLLTEGAHDPTQEPAHPEQAVVAGPARVGPQEVPELRVRWIDGSPEDDAVVREITGGEADEVTIRSGRRWVRDLTPLHLERDQAPVPSAAVITGGLGGIGVIIAEDLVRQGVEHLVLTSRHGLPPETEWDSLLTQDHEAARARAISAVRRMRRAGARVEVRSVDVTATHEMAALRAELGDRTIGIVHAAGVPGGGMIAVKQRDAVREVIAPKVDGAQALREAFADARLSWVALFSSVTGSIGGVGQVDYCAANAALDAMSARPWGASQVLPVSLGWGGWSQVGMAAEADPDAPAGSVQESVIDHPVLTRRDQQSVFGSICADSHWLLGEHRIEGVPVVPGTGHLSMLVRAADDLLPGPGAVEVSNLVFATPFAVPDDEMATYRIEVEPDGSVAVVGERLAATVTHATATLGRVAAGSPARVDMEAFLAGGQVDLEQDSDRGSVVTFGPHWECLRSVRSEPGVRDVAEISLPEQFRGEADHWDLHPAALDVATSFGFGHATGPFLPLGYGAVVVHGPLPSHFFAELTYHPGTQGSVSADVRLVAEDGTVLLEAQDYTLRQVTPGAITDGSGPSRDEQPETSTRPVASIRPVEGARALRRVLAAGLNGPVLVTPRPVTEFGGGALAVVPTQTPTPQAQGASPDAEATDSIEVGSTDLETQIAEIWQRVLGIDQVNPQDDFFALGGNSLVAVQLVAEIRRATKVKLPMKALFEMPTVAQVAKGVEALRAAGAAAPVVPRVERN